MSVSGRIKMLLLKHKTDVCITENAKKAKFGVGVIFDFIKSDTESRNADWNGN